MHLSKSTIYLSTLIFFSCLSFTEVYALSWYQVTSINNDRSGKIKLSYWDASSQIKDAAFYKSLPFTEDKIRETYASDNNIIDNISISKNNPETTYVNVMITFKDILKINTAQGFSKIITTWFKTTDSTTLLYKFDKNEDFANISTVIYTFELPTKEILRSSGIKMKENTISVGLKPENFMNGTTIYAVFGNSTIDPQPTNNQSGIKTQPEGTENKKPEKGKRCGLFSIELPIIFCSGLFITRRENRKI